MNQTAPNQPITFHCHVCNTTLQAPPQQAGRLARCSKCNAINVVPPNPAAANAATQNQQAPRPAKQADHSLDDTDFNLTAITEAATSLMPKKHRPHEPAFAPSSQATITSEQRASIVGPPVYFEQETPEQTPKQPRTASLHSPNLRAYLFASAAAALIAATWVGLYIITAQPLTYLAPIFALAIAYIARSNAAIRTKTLAFSITAITLLTLFVARNTMSMWAYTLVAPRIAISNPEQIFTAVSIQMRETGSFSQDIQQRQQDLLNGDRHAGYQLTREIQKLQFDIENEIHDNIRHMSHAQKLDAINFLLSEHEPSKELVRNTYSPAFSSWEVFAIPLAAIIPLLLCKPPKLYDQD